MPQSFPHPLLRSAFPDQKDKYKEFRLIPGHSLSNDPQRLWKLVFYSFLPGTNERILLSLPETVETIRMLYSSYLELI